MALETISLGELYNSESSILLTHEVAVILLNIVAYLYVITKIFKVMCYSKLTFEWLPLINPYVWPFSLFNAITNPYFRMWSQILPPIKFEKTSIEISAIIALEALNSLIYFFVRCSHVLVAILQETERLLGIPTLS
jgi:uncharacterized protein YggT (Ycf19 family)